MKRFVYAVLFGLLTPGVALAAEEKKPAPEKKQEQLKKQEEVIYGRQLMTPKEMTEYRAKMRTAKTAEEREKLRKEHHDKMAARAKERGVKIPDEPPARGPGMGPGKGMGPGGGGMGPRY
jgi:hypothetical protein